MLDLKGKKVVITGGNRGIGRAIAMTFALQGADVIITYNSDPKSADTVVEEIQKLDVKAKAIQIDVRNEKARSQLLQESLAFLGDVDFFINNAGIATRKPFLELPKDEVTKIFEINLLAPFFLLQEFGKYMAAQQQKLIDQNKELKDYCIINITSISREVITPGLSHYEASKAGLSQLSKSVALELARYKIRVNDVAPGLVPTDINRNQWETNTSVWQKRVDGIPLSRAGKPEEIALAVLSVAINPWMTGTTITVDGGKTLNWYGMDIAT